MTNVWKNIKQWFKKNWGYFVAALGALAGGIFLGLHTNKHRGLDTNTELCKSAESGITKVTESVSTAAGRLDEATGTLGDLKQSINDSQNRVSDSSDTVGRLISDTNDIKAIIDKYNKGIESTSEKE